MSRVAAVEIVKLGKEHTFDSFGCGNSKLNSFLKKYARQHHELGYSVTFLASTPDEPEAIGYITMNASNITLAEFETNVVEGIDIPKFFNMPTLHVGRVAVVTKYQGKGIGKRLLQHAFKVALDAHNVGAGIYAVDLWLDNEGLKAYYPQLGFKPVTAGSSHYYIPLNTIRKANEA